MYGLRHVPRWWLWLIAVVWMLSACSEESPATVTALHTAKPLPLPLHLTHVRGVRADYHINASLYFTVPEAHREVPAVTQLTVHIVLRVGIPTTFERGHYVSVRHGRQEAGYVTSPSVMFLGGQGAQPSIGGTFLLHRTDGAVVYRVTLPSTVLSQAGAAHTERR